MSQKDSNLHTGSLDVGSLFTNVPLDKTIYENGYMRTEGTGEVS